MHPLVQGEEGTSSKERTCTLSQNMLRNVDFLILTVLQIKRVRELYSIADMLSMDVVWHVKTVLPKH